MARGATRGATRCALLLIGTVALVLAPTTAARGLLSKTTAAPEMDEQGTVEAKGGTVQKEGAPNFWDLVGTASPTKIYTAAPTLDWTTKFTSSPTLDWSESYTASPTMDFRNFLGTNAPTADWTLAKLIGTTAPTYDWTTFFDKPGSDSAASVDAASVTMSPAKVQAQAVSAASSDGGGFSAFFVLVCAIGSALVGGAIVYKYTSSQAASLESTPLISDAASKSSSETDASAAITATEGPDSSRGYQAV
jgi:hypothetical protein